MGIEDPNLIPRILVIEDDLAVARSLRDGLTMDGYEVISCYSGGQGIKSIQKDQPHLVILDLRLPDGSGFDVCRKIRQMGFYQPLLILTVQDDDVDKVLGLEIGADDYMTKPYNPKELNARIRALLRRAYGEFSMTESKLLFIKDLVIDLMGAVVTRNGAEIYLTPTEYHLFIHPGDIVMLRKDLRVVNKEGLTYSMEL